MPAASSPTRCASATWPAAGHKVRIVRNRARRWTFEALLDVRRCLPFPLLGIDSDNGGEFINAHLVSWCSEQRLTFTRSRAYEKNDSCYVEQKNWSVVRRETGYGRYDTEVERELIAAIYADLRLYVNFFPVSYTHLRAHETR